MKTLKVKEITWKPGFPSRGVDVNDVYKELEDIRESERHITPRDVVDRAKENDSSMHGLFTWDDSKAAEKYRLNEAKAILRSIHVVFVEGPREPTRHYEYINIGTRKSKPINVYTSVDDLMNDPESRDALIARAYKDALSFRTRYSVLAELDDVIKALDLFVEDVRTRMIV